MIQKDYALKGWAVFPAVANTKIPAVKNGFKEASKDSEKISKWWTSGDFNTAIATGEVSGITIVDVDMKGGKNGRESLKKLNLPPTLTVKTPTGGWHLYYKYNPKIKTTVALLEAIDIRNDGAYVVAPPSQINGIDYEWIDYTQEIVALPNSFEVFFKDRPSGSPVVGTDQFIEGQRNDMLFSWGAKWRAKGMGEQELFASLCGINLVHINPPLPESEIRTICSSLMRYDRDDTKSVTQRMEMSDKIVKKLNTIDNEYDFWQRDKWIEMKNSFPKYTDAVHYALDNVNAIFKRWGEGKGTESEIKESIMEYKKCWEVLKSNFPR